MTKNARASRGARTNNSWMPTPEGSDMGRKDSQIEFYDFSGVECWYRVRISTSAARLGRGQVSGAARQRFQNRNRGHASENKTRANVSGVTCRRRNANGLYWCRSHASENKTRANIGSGGRAPAEHPRWLGGAESYPYETTFHDGCRNDEICE